jgi:23S rRNA (uracil1939-C5)-methyltransferase
MANIFSKHRSKLREKSKKQKAKTEATRVESHPADNGDAFFSSNGEIKRGASIRCQILSLSHEGRGIAKNKGKTQFVHYALPGELVQAEILVHRSKYDELKTVNVLKASDQRVEPKCQYYGVCGGCSLQHMNHGAQLAHKQDVLFDQLERFGNILPEEQLSPVESRPWAYRSRTRLSVDYGRQGEPLRIGYRKKNSKEILDIEACPVLDSALSDVFPELKALLLSLSGSKVVGHLELSSSNEGLVLLVRLVKQLAKDDQERLLQFAKQRSWILYLQQKGDESALKVWPEGKGDRISYNLTYESSEDAQLRFSFQPKDFTQINLGVNQQMVQLAIEALDLKPDEKALDLFSGLGNFSLAMAKFAATVVGVEGSQEMVSRGEENAKANNIENARFYASDLYDDFTAQAWAQDSYDKILIDPPRSGAFEIVSDIARFKAKRIVYISCNPATLARDAGVLVKQGYRLSKAGILDMFPHTEHLESIAIFDRE